MCLIKPPYSSPWMVVLECSVWVGGRESIGPFKGVHKVKYFHNTTEKLFTLFTVLPFALILEKQWLHSSGENCWGIAIPLTGWLLCSMAFCIISFYLPNPWKKSVYLVLPHHILVHQDTCMVPTNLLCWSKIFLLPPSPAIKYKLNYFSKHSRKSFSYHCFLCSWKVLYCWAARDPGYLYFDSSCLTYS